MKRLAFGWMIVAVLLCGNSLVVPLLAAMERSTPAARAGELPTSGDGRPGLIVEVGQVADSVRVEPVAIRIAAAGVDARVEPVGVVDGVMQDLPSTAVVGWYSDLAALGAGDNVVMAGYYKTNVTGPAVFSRLNALREGDEIEVTGSDGATYVYAVQWLRTFDDTQAAPISKIVGTTSVESLTLMTGAEPFDAGSGDYQGMTVARALLVEAPRQVATAPTTPAAPTQTATLASADSAKATATVGALQTQVASLSTEVAGLQTPATAQPPPSPTAAGLGGAGTPTMSSGGVDLLYYYVRDSQYGGAAILGEVRNTTRQIADAPQLNMTFYDAGGRIVDTAEADALHAVLEPGESMPIEGTTDLEPGEWAREEVRLQGGGPVTDLGLIFYARGLEVRNVNEVEKTTGDLRVLGEVYNGGTTAATLVEVEAAIYAANGRYAGREFTFVDADVLPAGESAAFEIDGQIDAGVGWTYRLFVSGWPSS